MKDEAEVIKEFNGMSPSHISSELIKKRSSI